jgi:hypothetical protein
MSPRNAPDAAEAARPFCCPATSGGHRAALFAARGCRMSRPEGAAGRLGRRTGWMATRSARCSRRGHA